MTKDFKTNLLLQNKHIQTLYASFFRKKIILDFEFETFTLSDGDFLECAWVNKPKALDKSKIVLILHGLEGSYKSPYVQGIMKALKKENFIPVLMHFRGCGKNANNSARAYHSGDTSDVKEYIKYLKQTYINATFYAVAYSIGGNVLLKLLGEEKENSPFIKSVSVCAPMQLNISADTIDKGFSRIYQNHLLKHLKATLKEKYKNFPLKEYILEEEKDIDKIKSIRAFDNIYTSRMHGFKDDVEYYELSSSKQYIKDIKSDTLIIHASDDPFMTNDVLPNLLEIPNNVKMSIQKRGGHVGFVYGNIFNPKYWTEEKILQYFLN